MYLSRVGEEKPGLMAAKDFKLLTDYSNRSHIIEELPSQSMALDQNQ